MQSQYLYDALGSALFDAICRLPWYQITRAEARLLALHAPAILSEALSGSEGGLRIVELGAGNGEKLAQLVEALPAAATADIHLIDVSLTALDAAAARLARYHRVAVHPCEATYQEGLTRVRRTGSGGGRDLVLFLGSNIGNFDADAAYGLLRAVRASTRAGDLLLLGADLVKPASDLTLAYNDPLGVTAAFNKNLLVRINRELGGTFDLEAFDHAARWNEAARRVEMHLVSRGARDVTVAAADLRVSFGPGESIWTESSYKYSEPDIVALGAGTGFTLLEQWVDEEARFALTLFAAA